MRVVFDLDGTLVDSRADIVSATNFALAAAGRPPLPDRVVTGYIGDGARSLMARAAGLPEHDPAVEPFLRSFLDHYGDHATERTLPLPGAVAVLETLQQTVPLALCTNKPRRTTLRVLSALGLHGYFSALVCGDDLPERKPHPAPLLAIGERLRCSVHAMVMVGDGPQDVECAQRAGARSVGVVGNIAPRSALEQAGPDALIGSLSELLPLLYRWGQATKR